MNKRELDISPAEGNIGASLDVSVGFLKSTIVE
jgi:hypothetical protein